MTSQANVLIARNELNTHQVGCSSSDAKLLPNKRIGTPLENQRYFSTNTLMLFEFRRKMEMSNKSLNLAAQERRVKTSDMLDKAVRFAQLLSDSSIQKKRGSDERDNSAQILRTNALAQWTPHDNDEPCLPPRGVKYQRRNSFVIPKHRSMAFQCFNARQESIESLTNDLSLQENGKFTSSQKSV